MRYLPLILKNCWRNRRRTLLTVASIGVSMCLLGLMISLYHAFYLSAPAPEQARRLVVRNRVSLAVPMPIFYQAHIRQIPGVEEVMIANWFGGVYRDNRDPKNMFARFSVEPEKLFKLYGEFHIPEDQKQAFIRDRTGCVVGRDLANDFGFKIGDRIHLTGDIYPGDFEFTVRGIFDADQSTKLMYFNKEYIDQSMPEGRRGDVGMYYVLIDDPAKSAPVSDAIDASYRNAPQETKTETEQAFGVGFLSLIGNVKMFLMAISAAVTFTILLVSANTVAMAVRERTRETAILRTLGFTPMEILQMVVGESILISTVGAVIGLVPGSIMAAGLAAVAGGFGAQSLRWQAACIVLAMGALVGFFASLVPALIASRKNVVESLRFSG